MSGFKTMNLLLFQLLCAAQSFTFPLSRSSFSPSFRTKARISRSSRCSSSKFRMKTDLVTYLRTEYIAAALCTNQTPGAADIALELGTSDGRMVQFLPRTIRTLITSSNEPSATLSVSTKRQLRQMLDRRFGNEDDMTGRFSIRMEDQRADDLKEVENESVDVVVSILNAETMKDNGLDWKKSVLEAVRVLKPEGRLLFVERTDLGFLNYLSEIQEEQQIWEDVGFDDVDLVLTPHVAGVAIKSKFAGMSLKEKAEYEKKKEGEMYAERSLATFERRSRRRKKKKKKEATEEN